MSAKIFSADQIGREAKISIRGQRHRCSNPNASDYKYYGAKGVKVVYTSEEFYPWFRKQRKKIPLNIKVNVDRIKHDGNYSLDNVRLVPKIDNVIESNTRRAKLIQRNVIKDMLNGLKQYEIGEKYGVAQTAVSAFCKKHNIKWERNEQ